MSLQGKKILLGVSGGIAAYKSALLTRLLVKEGAEVKVMMTPGAKAFIGALTFSTLSKNPVAVDFYNESDGTWNNHVAAGMWGDLILIAPATANTISKMAVGMSDNFLITTYLSAKCPVAIAPAMDLDMWLHSTTQKNIQTLKSNGVLMLDPESGELASGLNGTGRMAEPEHILSWLQKYFDTAPKRLAGKKVLITAGPTYEAIDPVRFIGNHSSGKMGFALATAFEREGAAVTVVHGPVEAALIPDSISTIAVTGAEEMLNACLPQFETTDIFVAAAAVADFTPVAPSDKKIKKSEQPDALLELQLKRTPDILKTLSAGKTKQVVIGFALETDNEAANAAKKLQQKGLDMIVLNSMNDSGAGFKHDTNKITILDKFGNQTNFELKSKQAVANDIVNYIINNLHA
ncbi:MAG: bifunctional phosphopantothenoylcysteine decarboxylase/phosphopantothenate--cysteine ligase CoaBC [Bacteroidetes bacterium]|nr:bifunctional phosphopantothenoylcysteine decarboxylase/phosphopantothenate--cysteine ligase CoaBC [Bacteroidota bacterium]